MRLQKNKNYALDFSQFYAIQMIITFVGWIDFCTPIEANSRQLNTGVSHAFYLFDYWLHYSIWIIRLPTRRNTRYWRAKERKKCTMAMQWKRIKCPFNAHLKTCLSNASSCPTNHIKNPCAPFLSLRSLAIFSGYCKWKSNVLHFELCITSD